jgi:azurin
LFAVGAAARLADAACELDIDANDLLQFNTRAMTVSGECERITVTLHHVGRQAAHVIGHDWVLARSSDVPALAAAGVAAGFVHGYLPEGDQRIVAATRVIGGGESATVSFDAGRLAPGVEYSYFCSYPGHLALMKGRFRVERNAGSTVAAR